MIARKSVGAGREVLSDFTVDQMHAIENPRLLHHMGVLYHELERSGGGPIGSARCTSRGRIVPPTSPRSPKIINRLIGKIN